MEFQLILQTTFYFPPLSYPIFLFLLNPSLFSSIIYSLPPLLIPHYFYCWLFLLYSREEDRDDDKEKKSLFRTRSPFSSHHRQHEHPFSLPSSSSSSFGNSPAPTHSFHSFCRELIPLLVLDLRSSSSSSSASKEMSWGKIFDLWFCCCWLFRIQFHLSSFFLPSLFFFIIMKFIKEVSDLIPDWVNREICQKCREESEWRRGGGKMGARCRVHHRQLSYLLT